jgi:4-hydroxybenzoate polyprenyltransferase
LRSILISRVMHGLTIACMLLVGYVAGLGPFYMAGVALVAVLLAYEQSLVAADDLSQVKRAFDLNGYVGILYLVTTAAAIYIR